jgi:RimJ/RimL family protein N-acetyltransferase
MEYGIQRASIELMPPTRTELEWVFGQFDEEEIWRMFGYTSPSGASTRRRYDAGNVVVGIAHRSRDHRRVGFVIVFPPKLDRDHWEIGLAIPNPKNRGSGLAKDMADAIGHYLFDHLRIERAGLLVLRDNLASAALVKKLGYRRHCGFRNDEGLWVDLFAITPELWAERRGCVEAEAEDPPFVMLETTALLSA